MQVNIGGLILTTVVDWAGWIAPLNVLTYVAMLYLLSALVQISIDHLDTLITR